MCSHYQALKERTRFEKQFDVQLPLNAGVYDVWPTYAALFIPRPAEAEGEVFFAGDAKWLTGESSSGKKSRNKSQLRELFTELP